MYKTTSLSINSNDCAEKDLLTNSEGFAVLYDRYWKQLYKKALSRLGNRDDAEDVVQDIFISMWRNRETIEVNGTVLHYLLIALKYRIIKTIYKKARQGINTPLSVETLEQLDISTEEILQYKQLQEALAREITKLPQRMQEIYYLSREQNLKITEIAKLLNLSEQTVKNTLTILLKRLRKKLSHLANNNFTLFL